MSPSSRYATINSDYPASDLTDAQKRHIWVQTQLRTVTNNYLDGINIDFEGTIPKTRVDLRDGLSALVNEAFKTFKHALPHSQVTIDVPYGPDCVFNRCYDYPALSVVVDVFFIMEYDELGEGLASPNSGIPRTFKGLSRYIDLLPSQKLLLGVPRYSYKYKCATLTKNDLCKTSGARTSMPFSDIYRLLLDSGAQRVWNKANLSPFFKYKEPTTNELYQIWYDDPESLLYKYALAARTNLRGVGVWHDDCVDYDKSTMFNFVRQWMWHVLPLRSVKDIVT
ncbi:di-N-acetylchitobiase-like [Haliotis rubra]|uniref:di-N-acetylchitobiase-like n=1 Tax=Haliotis rubra TaxID=36100 RepID=UPI001EE57EAC|nr:di-N-acetylchitobiase-like [Haliotis rubra]